MNTEKIIQILENSGFYNVYTDNAYVYMEDPSCVLRDFQTFAEFAWIAVTVLTGLMLTGWAISMIRGAKNDIFENLKNLVLFFGTLSAVGALINLVYGADIFARGCNTIRAPINELNKMLDARNTTFSGGDLYEKLEIIDSGPVTPTNEEISQQEIKETLKELEQYENLGTENQTDDERLSQGEARIE